MSFALDLAADGLQQLVHVLDDARVLVKGAVVFFVVLQLAGERVSALVALH